MKKRIFLSPPYVGAAERKAVMRAFDSGYVAPCGPMVDLFERRLASLAGVSSAVALSSGTGAIDLLMEEFGVGKGWTVIAPSLTFIATVAPAVHRGARIAFIDSGRDLSADPGLLEKALKTVKGRKLVMGVDLYGRCCDYGAFEELAEKYGARLVMDSAEAVGARRGSRAAGTAGAAGIYSFNGNKIITTSGGGAIVTDDKALADRARERSRQSRERVAWYEHKEAGWNYRMSNILAAVGLAQLSRLDSILEKRRRIADLYREELSGDGRVSFVPQVSGENHWLNVIMLESPEARDRVLAGLAAENIEARHVWKPMHMQRLFRKAEFFGGGTSEDAFMRGVCLPSGTGMTASDVRRTARIVRAAARG